MTGKFSNLSQSPVGKGYQVSFLTCPIGKGYQVSFLTCPIGTGKFSSGKPQTKIPFLLGKPLENLWKTLNLTKKGSLFLFQIPFLKAGPRHKVFQRKTYLALRDRLENLAGIGKILRIPSKEKIFF